MADHSLTDSDPPRRPRRGPPPRLYVIARQSPVPWLRVRRLGEADRAAFVAHLLALAAAHRVAGSAAVAATCRAVDFRSTILFGAIAGNAIVAAACGALGDGGEPVVATELADYRRHGLADMLTDQVMGARPEAELPRQVEDPAVPLMALMRCLGGRSRPEV